MNLDEILSTSLWEANHSGMQNSLEEHNSLWLSDHHLVSKGPVIICHLGGRRICGGGGISPNWQALSGDQERKRRKLFDEVGSIYYLIDDLVQNYYNEIVSVVVVLMY